MKILIVSLSNRGGGASRAVSSLAKALMHTGHCVEVLTYEGGPTDYTTTIINKNSILKIVFRFKNWIARLFMSLFPNPSHDYRSIAFFPSSLLKMINSSDSDLVHLHWIGGEMISVRQLGRINKPTIWTLHDGWALHGCYHIEPSSYEPFQITPNSGWLDRWVLRRKKRSWRYSKFCFTTPSHWLREDFEHSWLNNGRNTCITIRNIIDASVWHATPKAKAREALGFDEKKKHVLFIANNLLSSFNKGYVHVEKLLDLCRDSCFQFHFIGTNQAVSHSNVVVHGKIWEQSRLALFYSACDITLQPSFSENLSYVSIESILCGTPLLCFATTGLDEIVQQGVNGYKARKFDIADLYYGLEYLAGKQFEKPIEESVSDYLPDLNIKRYLELYESLL